MTIEIEKTSVDDLHLPLPDDDDYTTILIEGSASVQMPKDNSIRIEHVGRRFIGEDISKRAERLIGVHWKDIKPELRTGGLLEGILFPREFSILFGKSGSTKTFAALDLAVHIAQGLTWFSRKTQQSLVYYIAGEGQRSITWRKEAIMKHYNTPDDIPFILVPNIVDLCSPAGDTSPIIEAIKMNETYFGLPCGLVVIDTVARAMAGGDENSAKDMGSFVVNCDRIREETNAHVLGVHHTGHSNEERERGHSSLRAALDCSLKATYNKVQGIGRISVEKLKDSESGVPLAVYGLKNYAVGFAEDGTEIDAAALVHSTDDNGGLTKRHRDALSAMEQDGSRTWSWDAWKVLLKDFEVLKADAPRSAYTRLRDDLVDKNWITVKAEGENSKYAGWITLKE